MYELVTDFYPYFQYKKATKPSKGIIFFIHGYAVNSDYHNSFSDLVQDYDYYAIEHPGHGITPLKNKKQLKPYAFATNIVQLIETLDLKEINLIGHSMGGGIAMMVAQMIPDRIKKLVIVTPMNSKGTTKVFNFLFKFNPKSEKELDKFYDILMYDYKQNKHLISPQERQGVINLQTKFKNNFNILKRNMASIQNMKKLKLFEKNIKQPTLLIVGAGDDCINAKSTIKNLTKKNSNLHVYEFKEAGHIPFVEKLNEYYNVIMDFLNE